MDHRPIRFIHSSFDEEMSNAECMGFSKYFIAEYFLHVIIIIIWNGRNSFQNDYKNDHSDTCLQFTSSRHPKSLQTIIRSLLYQLIMAPRVIIILLFSLTYSTITLTAPVPQSQNSIGDGRPRRQTLGKPSIASVMVASSIENCPIYGDGDCGKIQDMLCAAHEFQQEYLRRQESQVCAVL